MSNKPNLGPVSEELTFLLRMLRSESSRGNTVEIKQDKTLDWQHLHELARHHRVFPMIVKRLNTSSIKQEVSEEVLQLMNRDYEQNMIRMLHLCRELQMIAKHFEQKGIRMIFLKGPLLAHELYGDISLRTSGDLDLLIERSQLPKAEQMMKELGFEKDDYFSTVLNDWTWRHHHICFFHPINKIKVELHWRLNPGPAREPNFEQLWLRRRENHVLSHSISLLGNEDLFLFLVSHGARHGWSRLRWLQDIDKLLGESLDIALLIKLLNRYQYSHLAGQALWLCEQLLHTEIPDEFTVLMQGKKSRRLASAALFYVRRIINLHDLPLPPEVSRYHKRYLFSLKSRRHKLLFVLSFLYPYPEDVQLLRLPRKLYFMYFPLRPILWLYRKIIGNFVVHKRGREM